MPLREVQYARVARKYIYKQFGGRLFRSPSSSFFLFLRHPPRLILERNGPLALNDHSCASKLMDDISLRFFFNFSSRRSTWIYKASERDQGCQPSTSTPPLFNFACISVRSTRREARVCARGEREGESESRREPAREGENEM